MCVRVCICTYMHIMLLIGLTGVCYLHLLLRLRAPIGVCTWCVCEGGKMYVVVCH